jgi:simple sugar transport system substrate-binding protein
MKQNSFLFLACSMLAVGGLRHAVAAEVPATVSSSATSTLPAPFNGKTVRIAVVRQLNTGDYYQAWIAGLSAQARALHIKLNIYNADGDNSKQALFLEEAVATHPDAIIIGWGFGASLQPGLAAARQAGIPAVIYDADVPASDMDVVVTQDHAAMMTGILGDLSKDVDDKAAQKIIYAYVAGYHALDLRNQVWQKFLVEHPAIHVVATVGVVNSDTAEQTANQVQAALTAHPDVHTVIAPYDEFAKGATLAVEQMNLQKTVQVYGMDISTADIAMMVKPGSPWTVTATTDAGNMGAVTLRVAALKVAGQIDGDLVSVPPLVITQAELRDEHVLNMSQLAAKFPGLLTADVAKAPWMGDAP